MVVPTDYLEDGKLPVKNVPSATDAWLHHLIMFRLADDAHVVICDVPLKCEHNLCCISPSLNIVAPVSNKSGKAELRYHGTLNGGKVSVFCDQGASHTFLNLATARRLGFKIVPTNDIHVKLVDGRTAPIKGTVSASLKLGKYVELVTFIVLNLHADFDVILGYDWLHDHHALIDCYADCVNIKHKGKTITLDTQVCPNQDALKVPPHLTAMQLKRQFRKKPFDPMFLVIFKETSPSIVEISPEFKDHQQPLNDILTEFKDIFVDGLPPGPPPLRHTQHAIPLLPGAHSVHRPPYRLAPEEKAEMERQIKDLLAAGYIRESSSPFASPVLFVPKPNGKWRMCIDYRALNKIYTKLISFAKD